jgi:uncharacterized protein involved in exopolysaccharide biosynthesis
MTFGRAEVYRGSSGFGNSAPPRRKNLVRFLIFLFVFVGSAVASLAYVFSRPPVYESIASVLITPPEAEQTSAPATIAISGNDASDTGIIGIERYQLLATPLLTQLVERLREEDSAWDGLPTDIAELRSVISIQQFETTNIVTLKATGPQPEILPIIVNRWLELYRETQAKGEQSSASDKNTQLQDQVAQLQRRIAIKRDELTQFRRRYDIVSMERDENQLLARLKGLTNSINVAREEEVKARGRLDAVNAALDSGKPIVDLQDQRRMANLEQSLTALQEKITEFEQRFTRRYMELDPNMMAVVRQRDQVEQQIAALREEATASALAAAEQDLASAGQSVDALLDEFERSKRQISEFSARFAEHEALVTQLAEIEAAHRQASDRLLRREVDADRGITKVEVVESAVLPIKPVWPNYNRDAGIGLGGSLILGLLAVLFYDFFNRPHRSPDADVNAIFVGADLARAAPVPTLETQAVGEAQLERQPAPEAISHQLASRALDEGEIAALMAAGDSEARLIIGLLLCGFSLDQIAALERGDCDMAAGIVAKRSQPHRKVAIPEALRAGLERHLSSAGTPDDPVWRDSDGAPRMREDLEALVNTAAHDAGLTEPEPATADGILHSYRVYLVEQGMRLADLDIVAGPISPSVRAAYSVHAPAGAAVGFDQIDLVYPALRDGGRE